MKKILLIGTLMMVLVACGSGSQKYGDETSKSFRSMIDNQSFEITSNWAFPQVTNAMQQVLASGVLQPSGSTGSISLIGNSNFLRISGDSITSYLPYFGERQMQVAYGGGDSVIEFKGLVKNFNIVQNKDDSYTINFEAKSNSENFDVYIHLSPNLNSDITVNGTSRNVIRYSGVATPIKE